MVCYNPIRAWQRTVYPIYAGENEEFLKKLNKISFHEIQGWHEISIPCGKCEGCKLQKSKEHSLRCYLEAKNWKNNCFVTLTYNQKNYPKDNQLHKEHIQLFFKRLRKLNKGNEEWTNPNTKKVEKPIRYFGCGEHGPKTNRVHWHFCLFNYKPKDLKFYKYEDKGGKIYNLYTSKELQKIWGYGFVIIGNLTEETANYVARYTLKKVKEKDECLMMSRNPGIAKWNWETKKETYKTDGILQKNHNGVTRQNLPKYFKKLWNSENWEEYEKYNFENKEKMKIANKNKVNSYNLNYGFQKSDLSTDEKISLTLDKIRPKELEIKKDKIKTLKRTEFE